VPPARAAPARESGTTIHPPIPHGTCGHLY